MMGGREYLGMWCHITIARAARVDAPRVDEERNTVTTGARPLTFSFVVLCCPSVCFSHFCSDFGDAAAGVSDVKGRYCRGAGPGAPIPTSRLLRALFLFFVFVFVCFRF